MNYGKMPTVPRKSRPRFLEGAVYMSVSSMRSFTREAKPASSLAPAICFAPRHAGSTSNLVFSTRIFRNSPAEGVSNAAPGLRAWKTSQQS